MVDKPVARRELDCDRLELTARCVESYRNMARAGGGLTYCNLF